MQYGSAKGGDKILTQKEIDEELERHSIGQCKTCHPAHKNKCITVKLAFALADARLEVARLKVERDRQRKDIQRLIAAAEAVCAKACLTGRKGEDGWTYQVGRDGDAALRALAGIRDEFAAKYTEGSGMRLDDMTHHVGDDCPGGHVAGLRGLKETLITVAPDWTEWLTEEERGGWLDRTGPGYARLHQTLGTVAALRALV